MKTPLFWKRVLIAIAVALVTTGTVLHILHQRTIFKSYDVSVTTNGQEVSVSAIYLDHKWAVPGGASITGHWDDALGGASLFDKPRPHNIYINWEDKASRQHYEATIPLESNLASLARRLPGYTYLPTQEKDHGSIYLIIGLAKNGHVAIWLSNAPSGRFRKGRVLRVVGKTQGRKTRNIAPFYPS